MISPDAPRFLGYQQGCNLSSSKKEKAFLKFNSETQDEDIPQNKVIQMRIISRQKNNISPDLWVWRVTSSMVHTLSPCSPFNSMISVQGIRVPTIATRISYFMKIHSVVCKYHSDIAEVECALWRRWRLIKFTVRLWKKHSSTGTDNSRLEPIFLLEIQRQQGCCLEMRAIRRSLLHAVSTGDSPAVDVAHHQQDLQTNSLNEKMREEEVTQQVEIPPAALELEKHKLDDSLAIALNLLKGNYLDQKLLGMESLCMLTDLSVANRHTADHASRSLIFGCGKFGKELQKQMVAYLANTKHLPENESNLAYRVQQCAWDCPDLVDDGDTECAQGDFHGIMHSLTLYVLCNALGVISQGEGFQILELKNHFWEAALERLIYNLTLFSSRPHEAALSAQSLAKILPIMADANLWDKMFEDQLYQILERACTYGTNYNRHLEQECRCLKRRIVEILHSDATGYYTNKREACLTRP